MILIINSIKALVFAAQTERLRKFAEGLLNTCYAKNVIQSAKIRVIKCVKYTADNVCFRGKAMANYPQELAQDAVCQNHTSHTTGLWFLPTRPLRLNTNE